MASGYHDDPEGTLVLYDLRDASAWKRAGREIETWGKSRTTVHPMGSEHIVIEFRPGGARDLEGTA